jgi:hypothetical protein
MTSPGLPLLDRVLMKVRVDEDGCWVFTGSKVSGRYGHLGGSTSLRAHRITFEALVGPIPEGLELDHLCRKPACVRPEHLEPVSHAENMRRTRKSHCPRGHALNSANTSRYGTTRHCLECRPINWREYVERQRASDPQWRRRRALGVTAPEPVGDMPRWAPGTSAA